MRLQRNTKGYIVIKMVTLFIVLLVAGTAMLGSYLAPDDLAQCQTLPSLEGVCQKADAVVAIPGGRDTIESVEMIDAEMERMGVDSVTLVSDRLHLARSKAVAAALGLDAHVSGRAFADGSSFIPGRVLREAGGVARLHVWDRWFLTLPDDLAVTTG